jgi:S1-C subfamily serine protease
LLKVDNNPFVGHRGAPIQLGGTSLTAHYKQATLAPDLPEAGQNILLAGYPLGQPYAVVQAGTVASIAYDLPGWGETVKILISTVANHGNSGGPVFDDHGKVIGLLEGEFPGDSRTGIEIVVPSYFLSRILDAIHD